MSLMRHLLHFRTRSSYYNDLLNRALQLRTTEKMLSDAVVASVVISVHDLWASAARSVVLQSATGNTITRTGRHLPRVTTLCGYNGPMDFLRSNWSSKRMARSWEPDWFIPQNAIRAATLLRVANEMEITNGFGASTAPDPLRITRNVIAHSLPNTWQRFRNLNNQMGMSPMKSPADFVLSFKPRTGSRYIQDWIDEIEIAITIAIE
jgi:hypothetical protein